MSRSRPIPPASERWLLDAGHGARILASRAQQGWLLTIEREDQTAVIEPLTVQPAGAASVAGRWEQVRALNGTLLAQGQVEHATGALRFELRISIDRSLRPLQPILLDWSVDIARGILHGALLYPLTLRDVPRDPGCLDLPSLHYGRVSYGSGTFPHPDPRAGFAFRADRMAQPALHYSAPAATWSIFCANETPAPAQPELTLALGLQPVGESDLRVVVRYPQEEYGQGGSQSRDAYIAKATFGEGEQAYCSWREGDRLRLTIFVACRAATAAHDYASIARYLWQRSAAPPAQPPETLLAQAGEHIRWFNHRLYRPEIGGGQYESPEGSGTAMLGFVEQSLLMASTTLRYVALQHQTGRPLEATLARFGAQAAAALTHWTTSGVSPEGLLYPAYDRSGYCFGYRDYSDYDNLTIVRDDSFDTIRLAGESRSLLAAALSARTSGLASAAAIDAWERAALQVAAWLARHQLPAGGYSGRYHRSGAALDTYPGGTAAVIGLFCDCARWLSARDSAAAQAYLERAISAYASGLAPLMRQGAFAGGTLDASCPDREAAIAALDAALTLYEMTQDDRYLQDARAAADNILSYTLTYAISTFSPESDAGRQGISTRGATIVSPENQHLDPVTTAPALLLYGLYADDPVASDAAIATLHWALDGRWAIREAEGLKQSEQLLHTRWYYNTFFARRGDYRRGMPLWGRPDSEHGWPQVVPTAAFLATGQLLIDWRTRRALAIDGWRLEQVEAHHDALHLRLIATAPATPSATSDLLLNIVRLPRSWLTLSIDGATTRLSSDQFAQGRLLTIPAGRVVDLRIGLTSGAY